MAPKKQSPHTTRRFLGNGTYGCVFTPPLKCESGPSTSPLGEMVGKVFFSEREYKKEKAVLEFIRDEMDPQGLFTLTLKKSCPIATPSESDLKDASQECKGLRGKERQVIYPDGGEDLINYLQNSKGDTKAFLQWFQSMRPIFYGLTVLKASKMIHSDIKPSNILYAWKKKRCVLIDFGLLKMGESMYSSYDSIRDADYVYFPPEYKLSNMLIQKKKNITMGGVVSSFRRNFHRDMKELFELYDVNVDKDIAQMLDNVDVALRRGGHKEVMELMKRWVYKVDVYSLGIAISDIIRMLSLDSVESTKSRTSIEKLKLGAIENLLHNMLRVNPDERWDPDRVWNAYQKICGFGMSQARVTSV